MVEHSLFLQTSATNALFVSLILLTRRAGYLLLSSINHSSPGPKMGISNKNGQAAKSVQGECFPCYITTGAVAAPPPPHVVSHTRLVPVFFKVLDCVSVNSCPVKTPWVHTPYYDTAQNLGDPAHLLNWPACNATLPLLHPQLMT